MNEPQDQFDDPALKNALKRAFAQDGAGSAPPALRSRVEAMLSAGLPPASAADQVIRRPHRSWWRKQLTLRTGVAAAITAVAVGFMVVRVRTELFPPTETTTPTYYNATFPASLANAMVQVHDAAINQPAAHLSARTGAPSAVKARFSSATGVTVAAVELGDGWKYIGAGLCQLDGQQAAELVFTRGADSVSVFSMRAPPSCENGSGSYQQMVSQHPIAGVMTRGAVYCVVGSNPSGKMTTQQLQPLLATVEAASPGTAAPPSRFR